MNARKPPPPRVRPQPQRREWGLSWQPAGRGARGDPPPGAEAEAEAEASPGCSYGDAGGGPEEAQPLTCSRGYVRGCRRRKCGGGGCGGGRGPGLPGCRAAGLLGSWAAWPLRAGCHGGNAAGAVGLGPGPITSLPGLPAPRFGTRGSARCEGLVASAPRPAPRSPALPWSLPLASNSAPRDYLAPLQPYCVRFATETNPSFPNSFSPRSFLHLIPRKGFYL